MPSCLLNTASTPKIIIHLQKLYGKKLIATSTVTYQISTDSWRSFLAPYRGMQMDKALFGRQRPCFLNPRAWAKSILIYFKYIHYCPLETHYHFVVLRESDRALFVAALGISNHCVASLAIPCASVRDICLFSVTNTHSGRRLRSMQITQHKCERSQGPASPAARHNQPMVTDWFQFINSQWTPHLFQNW